MRWWWLLGAAGLFLVAAAAIWNAFQSPQFMVAAAGLVVATIWRLVAPQIAKRMTPEQEAAMAECHRRNGRWDPVKKRCDNLK